MPDHPHLKFLFTVYSSQDTNGMSAAHKSPLRRSQDTTATPVVQMHGMGDWANDPFGMVPLAKDISAYLGGAYVLNVQIGANSIADILNGFLMNLDDQVDYFANVVRADSQLASGFNAIGYSQGNLVIRGYIERYNSPPVLNFISMHGPLAGVSGFPGCSLDKSLCKVFAEVLGGLAYKPAIQDHLAQANYFRDPLKVQAYQQNARFLPDINNEDSSAAAEYSTRFEALQSLVLVKALGDTVVIPNDSEWFGSYQDGSLEDIWGFSQTPWYTSDLFGLQTLDKQEKVFFYTTDGDHLDFETDFLLDLVGQYFV
ncbi:hypothetical protein EON65_20820 [archaeon]|nr:MAG: hypothetical protein EON65_20820 [archaeon]